MAQIKGRQKAVKKTTRGHAKSAFPTTKIFLAAALIPFLFGGYAFHRWYGRDQRQAPLLASVSQIDFNGVEPHVVQKIEKLVRAIRKDSRSGEAWGKLAMNLNVHDYKKESLPIYMEAARLEPSNMRWPYFMAIVLSESGNQESLEWFERASHVKPDYAPLLINYGNALVEFGKLEEAALKYQQALKIDPRNSHALLQLGHISFAKGDLQESRSHLTTAIAANPSHRAVYELLITICKQQQDTVCVQRADAFAHRMPEKISLVDPVYAELSLEGESSLWYRFRGSEFMKNGMPERAILEFERALDLRSDLQTQEDLAKALNAAGKYSEAIGQYRSILPRHPTDENYFGIALSHARMGSYAEAETFFRKAVERNPEFAEAYFNLAVLFAKRGQLEQTIQNLNEAVRIKPGYTEAHYHLGLAHIAGQDREAALKEYSMLSQMDLKLAERLLQAIETGTIGSTE